MHLFLWVNSKSTITIFMVSKSTITLLLIGDMPLKFANRCKYARFYTRRVMGPSKGIHIAVRYSVWTPLPLPPLFLTRPEWNRADSVSFLAPSPRTLTPISWQAIAAAAAQANGWWRGHKPTGGGVTSLPAAAATQANRLQRRRKGISSGSASKSAAAAQVNLQ